uniref:Uncharacterized protein n=1 Tax=Eutreptiella gymnastica TaxID=73025 RepID=A0A7S1HSV8_9EUGL|mmetsp:Transcript_102536/g.177124  ORF Transcript_102536/g.177124 Transcript_102536/m.177124 type:complete len:181 (+) Transcript_102536:767-1309(+)
MKAQMLLDALCKELSKLCAAFLCGDFTIACAVSKRFQTEKGVRRAVVKGLVNVLCTQLDFFNGSVLDGGWESRFAVHPQVSPIRGSRIIFLQLLISDLQTRFREGEWVDSAVPERVEASSCSCERVFSYMVASEFAQNTMCMCEGLWVRCNGEDVEDAHQTFPVQEEHTECSRECSTFGW